MKNAKYNSQKCPKSNRNIFFLSRKNRYPLTHIYMTGHFRLVQGLIFLLVSFCWSYRFFIHVFE